MKSYPNSNSDIINLSGPRLKYHDYILVAVLEKQIICDLFEGNEKYERLLQEIKKYDIKRDGLPYQKDLLKSLNMRRTELMNLMKDLYEDLQTKLCSPNAYNITGTEIWLFAKSTEEYWLIGLDKLDVIPRVGDHFTMQLLRGEKFSGCYFKVEEIFHEIRSGIHSIQIHLIDTLVKA